MSNINGFIFKIYSWQRISVLRNKENITPLSKDEKQSIMLKDAERKDTRQRVQEMMEYLKEQPVEITEYDE